MNFNVTRYLSVNSCLLCVALILGLLALPGCGGGGGDDKSGEEDVIGENSEGSLTTDGSNNDASDGDGDSSSDDDSSDDGTGEGGSTDVTRLNEVNESEFQASLSSGTWFSSGSAFYSRTSDPSVYSIDIEVSTKSISTVVVEETDVISQQCSEHLEYVESLADYTDFDLTDVEGGNFSECVEQDVIFYKTSDEQLAVEIYCEGSVAMSWEFEKQSDATQFDHGSLSFTSNLNDDIDAKSGVCGEVFELRTTTIDFSEDETTEENVIVSIDVSAPYGEDRVIMSMSFNEELAQKTYTVNSRSSETEVTEGVILDFSSFAFGVDGVEPVTLYGQSGEVTIESFTDNIASGSFDVLTSNGSGFTGNFTFYFVE
jgi:hypothetical protein